MPNPPTLQQIQADPAGFVRARIITEAALIDFARRVLGILETEADWNSDTLDEIALQARIRGLANSDKDGYFQPLTHTD